MPHPGPPDYLYTMNIVSINKEAYSLSYDNTTTMHIGKYLHRKQDVTQVQGELHIARKEVCYFVVWSPTEFHYQVRVQNGQTINFLSCFLFCGAGKSFCRDSHTKVES